MFGGSTLKDFAFALADRHRLRRLLVDLHRGAAPEHLEGPRDRVPPPRGDRHREGDARHGRPGPGRRHAADGASDAPRRPSGRAEQKADARRRPKACRSPAELSDEERAGAREAARRSDAKRAPPQAGPRPRPPHVGATAARTRSSDVRSSGTVAATRGARTPVLAESVPPGARLRRHEVRPRSERSYR